MLLQSGRWHILNVDFGICWTKVCLAHNLIEGFWFVLGYPNIKSWVAWTLKWSHRAGFPGSRGYWFCPTKVLTHWTRASRTITTLWPWAPQPNDIFMCTQMIFLDRYIIIIIIIVNLTSDFSMLARVGRLSPTAFGSQLYKLNHF